MLVKDRGSASHNSGGEGGVEREAVERWEGVVYTYHKFLAHR